MNIPAHPIAGLLLAACLAQAHGKPAVTPEGTPGKRADAPKRSKLYHKYTGTIDGKYPITLNLTVTDMGLGTQARGDYFYDKHGAPVPFSGNIHDSNRFEFQIYGDEGVSAPECFTGRSSSLDTLEGTWSKFKKDSAFNSSADTWTKNRPVKSLPFKLSKATTNTIPVVFEIFYREDRATSDRNRKEGKVEDHYDTLPSSFSMTVLKIKSANASIDARVNRAIARTLLDFRGIPENEKISETDPIGAFMDVLFSRSRSGSAGGFYDFDFACDVESNENDVLAIRYTENSYSGGAHGTYRHILESYDIQTGKKLSLEDILVPGYHKPLGALAGEPSCSYDPDNDLPCVLDGLIENGFAIQHDGLEFNKTLFGRETKVYIPYAKMARLIKKDGVLDRFRRRQR